MVASRPNRQCAAVVLLTALQPILLAAVGAAHYEPVQLFIAAGVVLVLYRFVGGSRMAWTLLVAGNALPLLATALIVLANPGTVGSGAIVLSATSGPILVVLLTQSVRRYIASAHVGRHRSVDSGSLP